MKKRPQPDQKVIEQVEEMGKAGVQAFVDQMREDVKALAEKHLYGYMAEHERRAEDLDRAIEYERQVSGKGYTIEKVEE